MKNVVFALLVFAAACSENLPTNETSEPQGAAGSVAASSESLTLGRTARDETKFVLSYNLFGSQPFCQDPVPGQTSCYTHPAPWADNGPWFYIIWGVGHVPVSQTSQVYFPQTHGPALYLGTITCSQTSCTNLSH